MPKRIFSHHDSDGVCSAHFLSLVTPDSSIKITDEFGSTKGWQKGDIMCDMRPDNPNIEGVVYDHHFPHPEDRKYKLIPEFPLKYFEYTNAVVPASLIVWKEHKDKIPKNQWWKLAIGLGGDGQLELMPTEVYDISPMLLQNVSVSIYQSYGNWRVTSIPLYMHLSSCINSFMRKGEYESALNLMKYADNPMDIYSSEDVRIAKLDVKNEFTSATKDANIFPFDENLIVVIFESRYRMSGYIASSLQSDFYNKTIMAINTRNGSVSLRGKLASYYQNKLKDIKYLTIQGHKEFMGGKLKKSYHTLIKDLNAIL